MRLRLAPWAVLLTAGLAYPVGVLATGLPRFPHSGECGHLARGGGNLEAVFGRFVEQGAADAQLARVRRVGFRAAQEERDGCGYVRVALRGIPTLAVGKALVDEAQKAGVLATLEQTAP